MAKAKQINLQPSENPEKKSVSKELLHLGTSGTVVCQCFTSRLKDLLVHHPRTPVRGFIPPISSLAPPTLSALPRESGDGQADHSWGERSHSGSPESPRTAVSSPPPQGTLPVVCRHNYGNRKGSLGGSFKQCYYRGGRTLNHTGKVKIKLLLVSKRRRPALTLIYPCSPDPGPLSSTTQSSHPT